MADRTVRVVLTGDATSLVAAAGAARRSLSELANTNVGRLGAGVRDVGAAATRTAQDTSSAFSKIKDSMAAQVSVGTLAAQAVQASFGAVGGAIASTMTLGIDYQDTLLNMGAVTQSSGDEMAKVSEKARQLGKDISIPGASATDAAKAMTELAKGGLSVADSMTAAKGTLQLAAASGIEAAQAAEIQVNAMSAFHLAADQAGRVADTLSNVANKSSGEITDFAYGLTAAGATAHSFGINLEDTTATLGLFANAGIKGEEGGTLMKTMLVRLAATSGPAAGALKDLGVTAYDASGKFVGMAKITDQLRAAHGKMTTEAFNSATAIAFGTRGIKGASILGSEAAGAFQDMAKGMHESGSAAAVANAKMSGLSGAFENINNQLQDVQLMVFDSFAPGLTAAANAFAGSIPTMVDGALSGISHIGSRVAEFFTPIYEGIGGLVHTIMPYLLDFGSSIKDGFTTALDAIAPLGASIGKLYDAIGDTGILNALGVALDGVGTAFSGVMKIIGPIVSAIGGVVGWFSQLATPVKAAALAFGALVLLKGPIAALFTSIKSGFDTLVLKAMYAGDAVAASGGVMRFSMASVATGAKAMWAAIGGWVTIGLSALVTVFTLFSSSMADSARNADSAKQGVEGLISALQQSNGVFDETARAAALAALKQQSWGESSTDLTTYAGNLGVKLKDLVDGMTGVAGASDGVEAAYQRQRAALQKLIEGGTRGTGDTRARTATAEQAKQAAATLKILDEQHAAYQQLTSAASGAGQAAADANEAVKGSGGAAGTAAAGFEPLNGLLGNVVTGFENIGFAADPAATSTEGFKTALDDAKAAAQGADTATQFLNQSLLELSGGNLSAAQQSRLNAAAFREIGGSARDAAAAHDKVGEAQKKLDDLSAHLGTTLNGEDASASNLVVTQADLDAATRALADAKDAETAASDKQADANDKAGASARDMAGAAYNAALKNGTMTDAINAAKKVLGEQRTKFIESATAAGTSKEAAEKLADAQGLIPANVETAYASLGIDDAVAKVAAFGKNLDIFDGKTYTAHIKADYASSVGSAISKAAGGVLAQFADGGRIVGNGGPREDNHIVAVSAGEYIVNAASTAKHLDKIEAINADKFADGGRVGRPKLQNRPKSQNGPSSQGGPSFDMHETTMGQSITAGFLDNVFAAMTADTNMFQKAIQKAFQGGDGNYPEGTRGKFMAAVASKMGSEYVWGAAGPDVFDCSGLMSWALAQAGASVGRLTAEGFNSGFPHIPNPNPGSLVTFDTGRLSGGQAGHIGMVLDPAAGTMMHTDGAGPARTSDYLHRGGLIGYVDPIGGTVKYSANQTGGDPPANLVDSIRNASSAAIGSIFRGITGGGGGPVGGLDEEQASNARAIASVALSRGLGRDGVLTGIVTAITESTLHNVAHGDAMGPSSTGLFQQMPPWGPYSVRMSPTGSAGLFYNALMNVPNWWNMSIPMRAQSVEQSEFSDGSNYAGNMSWAQSVTDLIMGSAAPAASFASNGSGGGSTGSSGSINGRKIFDNGGLLQPGWTQVYNGLGKPEKVFTDQQWSALSNSSNASGGTHRIVVEFRGDGPITQGMAQTAAYTVDGALNQLAVAINRQGLQSV